MKVYSKKEQLSQAISGFKGQDLTIGLVPTMGALHEGHLALVKSALKDNNKVVVSIFVNPTQFNNPDDLKKYPRTMDEDIRLLEEVDAENILVYAPTVEDVYEEGAVSEHFDFDGLEFEMEGKFRAGHFDGVGTVVKRLFEIVTPDRAYFGEKDFQQLQIIKKLVAKHNIPVEIVACEICREPSGLAMSSRNVRLHGGYKEAAPFIYKTLKSAKVNFGIKSVNDVVQWVENQFYENEFLDLEYFIIAEESTLKSIDTKNNNTNYRAFIAVYADDVRLIDNIALN